MRSDDRKPPRANGIILAGGRATRLGPISGQLSKAAISIGNKPQVIKQILSMRDAGVVSVVIVTSMETDRQIKNIVDASCVSDYIHVSTAVQETPHGPAHAIHTAMQSGQVSPDMSTYILMADTVLDEDLWNGSENSWIGTALPKSPRSWCWYSHTNNEYVDSIPPLGREVTIGAYYFSDTTELAYKASNVVFTSSGESEISMAPLLTQFATTKRRTMDTWLDIGDLTSLRAAKHSRFVSRPNHRLKLLRNGVLVKSGVRAEELEFMRTLTLDSSTARKSLFPQVYTVHDDWYSMELIDLPTLAEMWLYWPGNNDVWRGIISHLIYTLESELWIRCASSENAADWMVEKARTRLREFGISRDRELDTLRERIPSAGIWVQGHGDLNFNNILYSSNTGTFKLIDPRGTPVPVFYEYVKLAYSDIFTRVTHGLYDETGTYTSKTSYVKTASMHATIRQLSAYTQDQLRAGIALTLYAALPLHTPSEAAIFLGIADEYASN